MPMESTIPPTFNRHSADTISWIYSVDLGISTPIGGSEGLGSLNKEIQ